MRFSSSLALGVLLGTWLGSWLWSASLLLLLALLAVGALVVRRRARRKAPSRPTVPQKARLEPRRGLPLSGVRVLEIANTMAAPNAAKMLGELGAEVVKVEPPSGDTFRTFLSVLQPGREQSVVFDWINAEKNSVVIDYTTADGIRAVKRLLAEADVLVTNIRLDSLKRAGLDYGSLKDEFPQLIYAGLTAWGSVGPDVNLPGYDVGAFWAATGLSVVSQAHAEVGSYSYYVAGSGDILSSTALAFGITAALRERASSGHGQLVSTSLLKIGTWCMSPIHTTLPVPKETRPSSVPDYRRTDWNRVHPLDGCYMTADNVLLQLHCSRVKPVPATWPTDINYQDAEALRAAIRTMERAQVPFPHVPVLAAQDVWTCPAPTEHFKTANLFSPPPEPAKPDQPRFCTPVCSLSSLSPDEYRSKRAAPRLGEHTEAILRDGWSERAPGTLLPRASTTALPGSMSPAFRDVLVFEVTDYATLVPSLVGRALHEFGANVVRLQMEADPLAQSNAVLHDQLNKGKRSVSLQSWQGVRAILDKKASGSSAAVVLVTDLPRSVLRAAGIDYETLRAAFPRLVYAWLTPFGPEGAEEPRDSRAAFLALSGMAVSTMGLGHDRPSPYAPHFGDFVTGLHLSSGVSTALFALSRSGAGQRVDANFLRSGIYSHGVGAPVYLHSPESIRTSTLPTAAQMHGWYVQPTTNSYRTRDGFWLLMLGVDLPRHLPKMLKALDFRWDYWLKNLPRIARCVLREPDRLSKFKAFSRIMIADFAEVFAKKTYNEWKPILNAHDIWYCVVNTPVEARANDQCREIAIFDELPDGRTTHVHFPVRMYGQRTHEEHQAPQLGEANQEFL